MKKFILASVVFLFSFNAAADSHVGPYAGGGVGLSYGEVDDQYANDGRNDAHGRMAKLFLGYRFSDYLGAEVAIGRSNIESDLNDVEVEMDVTALSVILLPTYPVTDTLDAFMCLSYSIGDTSFDIDGPVSYNLDYEPTLDGFGIGVGVTKHFDNMFIRGAITSTLSNDESQQTAIGAGIDIGFTF